MKILVTGSAGFIGGYVVKELQARGHEVTGLDNFSKYGKPPAPGYQLIEGDAQDPALVFELLRDCDHLIAGAAMIGGIHYFHTWPYDLLAVNERITAATFDAAIKAHKHERLQKITVVSSSMVYESASWPHFEGQQLGIPPPESSYGFQKLATEYFARAAHEQYGLPFTIVRPFNCVGTGENPRQALSHVVPDLVLKTLQGQDPLHILGDGKQVRHYTYGGDLARGIVTAVEHPDALNEDFNLSSAQSTTVEWLARMIWRKINGGKPFRLAHDKPYPHDVQARVPETSKAKRVLGFEATTTLSQMLDEVIPWIKAHGPALSPPGG